MKMEEKAGGGSRGERVIVALDTPSLEGAEKILEELRGKLSFYKVGLEFFSAHGWEAVRLVHRFGGRVFLDLKIHDIPHTAERAAAVLCENRIEMFTVHTLGGLEMMSRVREAVDRCAPKSPRPLVLGVTILTSLTGESLKNELGIKKGLEQEVLALAGLARKAGLDGVVSSPAEIEILRKEFGRDFVLVTPGIRSASASKQDQKRTLDARAAFDRGADFIVLGRPITSNPRPREAAEALLESLH